MGVRDELHSSHGFGRVLGSRGSSAIVSKKMVAGHEFALEVTENKRYSHSVTARLAQVRRPAGGPDRAPSHARANQSAMPMMKASATLSDGTR